MRIRRFIVGGCVLLATGCGLERHGEDTGGVGQDGSGFLVINTDYRTTSTSLLAVDGEVLSESFISSRSAKPGLSAPLGYDVWCPSGVVPGQEIVLIDRFPASVLTWVEVETATVRAQLSVATGFVSNPYDYVEYSKEKAFVPRYEHNFDSGRVPFDEGDDVLIVDPGSATITGRIDLMPAIAGEPEGFYPRAGRALLAGGFLRVVASGFDADFTSRLDSRIISIDPETDAITDVLVFDTMTSCGSPSLSPDGSELALACQGFFKQDPSTGYPDSGVLVLEVGEKLVESRRFTAPSLGISQVSTVEWTGLDSIAIVTNGRFDARRQATVNDGFRVLNVRTGTLSPTLLESETEPFTLGSVRCILERNTCLLADAMRQGGVVHVFDVAPDGQLTLSHHVKTDKTLGLPPRHIGLYGLLP